MEMRNHQNPADNKGYMPLKRHIASTVASYLKKTATMINMTDNERN